MSVVPLAQEWMAAATGLEEGNCWEAVRNASRRKAKLSRLMIGRAGKGSEGGSGSGGAQESGAGGVAGREEETNEGLGRAIAEGDRAEGLGALRRRLRAAVHMHISMGSIIHASLIGMAIDLGDRGFFFVRKP